MQHRCSMLQFRTTQTTSHMSYQPSGEQRDEKTVSRVGRQFSFPAKTLLWYETVVKNYNGTALPDLFSKIFYFIPPEAMSDFLKYDNLLLFLIVKSSAGKKRYFMYSTVLTLDFLFSSTHHHCTFQVLSNDILDRALSLSFFFTILALQFPQTPATTALSFLLFSSLLPSFMAFSYFTKLSEYNQ